MQKIPFNASKTTMLAVSGLKKRCSLDKPHQRRWCWMRSPPTLSTPTNNLPSLPTCPRTRRRLAVCTRLDGTRRAVNLECPLCQSNQTWRDGCDRRRFDPMAGRPANQPGVDDAGSGNTKPARCPALRWILVCVALGATYLVMVIRFKLA